MALGAKFATITRIGSTYDNLFSFTDLGWDVVSGSGWFGNPRSDSGQPLGRLNLGTVAGLPPSDATGFWVVAKVNGVEYDRIFCEWMMGVQGGRNTRYFKILNVSNGRYLKIQNSWWNFYIRGDSATAYPSGITIEFYWDKRVIPDSRIETSNQITSRFGNSSGSIGGDDEKGYILEAVISGVLTDKRYVPNIMQNFVSGESRGNAYNSRLDFNNPRGGRDDRYLEFENSGSLGNRAFFLNKKPGLSAVFPDNSVFNLRKWIGPEPTANDVLALSSVITASGLPINDFLSSGQYGFTKDSNAGAEVIVGDTHNRALFVRTRQIPSENIDGFLVATLVNGTPFRELFIPRTPIVSALARSGFNSSFFRIYFSSSQYLNLWVFHGGLDGANQDLRFYLFGGTATLPARSQVRISYSRFNEVVEKTGIYAGSLPVKKIFRGSQEISKVYRGSQLIWPLTTKPATPIKPPITSRLLTSSGDDFALSNTNDHLEVTHSRSKSGSSGKKLIYQNSAGTTFNPNTQGNSIELNESPSTYDFLIHRFEVAIPRLSTYKETFFTTNQINRLSAVTNVSLSDTTLTFDTTRDSIKPEEIYGVKIPNKKSLNETTVKTRTTTTVNLRESIQNFDFLFFILNQHIVLFDVADITIGSSEIFRSNTQIVYDGNQSLQVFGFNDEDVGITRQQLWTGGVNTASTRGTPPSGVLSQSRKNFDLLNFRLDNSGQFSRPFLNLEGDAVSGIEFSGGLLEWTSLIRFQKTASTSRGTINKVIGYNIQDI